MADIIELIDPGSRTSMQTYSAFLDQVRRLIEVAGGSVAGCPGWAELVRSYGTLREHVDEATGLHRRPLTAATATRHEEMRQAIIAEHANLEKGRLAVLKFVNEQLEAEPGHPP